jgi:hypothetical protein
MKRTSLRWALAAVVLAAALSASAAHAIREVVVQWQSDGQGIDGFRLHVGPNSGSYLQSTDLGPVTPDVDGVYRYPLFVDETVDTFVAMTAYNQAGDSPTSNEMSYPAVASCDASTCDDQNACTVDDCSGPSCTNTPLPDGTFCGLNGSVCMGGSCTAVQCIADADCSDGDACNGAETCSSTGSCQAGAPLACGQATACAVPACDPLLGCTTVNVADGAACDDGDIATTGDACQSGVCVGTPVAAPTLEIVRIDPGQVGFGRHMVSVEGSGFELGATVTLENGPGQPPLVRSVALFDETLLVVDIEVRRGGPKRLRSWDVVVQLADGTVARMAGGLTIVP